MNVLSVIKKYLEDWFFFFSLAIAILLALFNVYSLLSEDANRANHDPVQKSDILRIIDNNQLSSLAKEQISLALRKNPNMTKVELERTVVQAKERDDDLRVNQFLGK